MGARGGGLTVCGIGGIVSTDTMQVEASRLEAMSAALAHRGPDGIGYLQWAHGRAPVVGRVARADLPANLAFVHRRLAIIDRTPEADQPMSSADGRYHLAYNGEIYNYLELRPRLAGDWCFRTASDTEVLLAALAVWGVAALERVQGMFAFALFDSVDQRLLLGRDHLGIKPLFIAGWPGSLAFASETSALLSLPVGRRADPTVVYDYLAYGRSDHGSRTFFEAIRQVGAGETVEVDVTRPERVSARRFWRPASLRPTDLSFDEAAATVRDLLDEAVSVHLRSDVPVGTALSGGIDSSSIVSLVRRSEPSAALHAISYVAEDPTLDESRWINQASDHSGADLHLVRVAPEDLVGDLDALIRAQGTPFGSTSIYAQYRVFEEAKRAGLTVMLDGQGADELFGGYRWHLARRLADLVRHGRLAAASRLVRRMPARQKVAAHAVMDLVPACTGHALLWAAGRSSGSDQLDKEWFTARGIALSSRPPSRRGLRASMNADLVEDHLPALLRYEDRNSMAWSIESRVPFLHRPLVDFVTSLPEDLVLGPDGATTKALLRRAMRGLVPDAILDRRDKIGFATPENAWLSGRWASTVEHSEAARRVPVLPVDRTAARPPAGSWRWRYLNLVRWTELFEVTYA